MFYAYVLSQRKILNLVPAFSFKFLYKHLSKGIPVYHVTRKLIWLANTMEPWKANESWASQEIHHFFFFYKGSPLLSVLSHTIPLDALQYESRLLSLFWNSSIRPTPSENSFTAKSTPVSFFYAWLDFRSVFRTSS